MPEQDTVRSTVDQICARSPHVTGVIGDKIDEGRAKVRRGSKELADDPQMVETRCSADDERKVVPSRCLDALNDQRGHQRKRQAVVDVRQHRRIYAEPREQRVRFDIQLAQKARDFDHDPQALLRASLVLSGLVAVEGKRMRMAGSDQPSVVRRSRPIHSRFQ